MVDALDGFEKSRFTAVGTTRTVYRTGTGPAVIVISEIPGITPHVAEFGRKVAASGCTAVLPHVFGEDGRRPTMGYAAKSLAQGCISREFTTMALNKTSPITTWLRALAKARSQVVMGLVLFSAMVVNSREMHPWASDLAAYPIVGRRPSSPNT